MSVPNYLKVHCSKCKLYDYCPSQGQSPLKLSSGKTSVQCKIPNGYSRKPPDPILVSEESKILQKENGPCLTIVDIPKMDVYSKHVYFEPTKIWHPPITHAREHTSEMIDRLIPKSYK